MVNTYIYGNYLHAVQHSHVVVSRTHNNSKLLHPNTLISTCNQNVHCPSLSPTAFGRISPWPSNRLRGLEVYGLAIRQRGDFPNMKRLRLTHMFCNFAHSYENETAVLEISAPKATTFLRQRISPSRSLHGLTCFSTHFTAQVGQDLL